MESTSSRVAIAIAALAILFLIGYVIWGRTHNSNAAVLLEERAATSTTELDLATSSPSVSNISSTNTSRVQLAVLDTQGLTKGKQRGCDRIVLVPYRIGAAIPSLDIAMRALFSWDEEQVGDWLHFIARINQTVSYSHSTVEENTANIFLTGDLPETVGSCDDQRIKTQIEETAYQFPGIQKVQIYLNNVPTDVSSDEQ